MTDTPTKEPADYTDGLGELMRAKRLYIGLSQRGMAKHLSDMDRRSYQRIENGQDAMPPGLMTTVDTLVDKFDSEVDSVISAAEREHEARGGRYLEVTVPRDPRQEWERCVVARAAVEGGLIRPVLSGED
ncbi:helix-turn-helix DNA-binding protein [Mycobacterium phage Holeinone]|uniref:Helix-turn-helix DNA-binding protein n=5 Tax=Rosebushvirus TaxID=1982900 RepID=S5WAV0_9CAUD|nr:HTH DNA binding protein [Mycobacterium phage TA17A]AIK68819.1 helix-turn-helix DNA-binding protein [Mycobacterium phage LizLemon]AUX82151.1 helix-turn-helix DNA-binding protein [Mycobacterium phage Holeinone]QCG77108.1 helix-turn-helix DNA-binding protein [Mycobacterium phage Bananafish]QFG13999.1 hypothetical protein SEA_RHINOFORTE_45 [Mycobacterium phage Rhinoforte]QYC54289.1 helix-turn-helix DNA-binding domain protein [Mycobacterium phage Allegro]UAW09016.1 helix-turn-helix DNA binding 